MKLGTHHTKEACVKISKANSGNPSYWAGKKMSLESRRKMSVANSKKRKPLSLKHCRNISIALKKAYLSPELRRKRSEAQKGTHLSKETKEKLRQINTGKKLSLEARRRLSEMNSGAKHPQWRGGVSFLPYSVDWTKTLRRSIRERDHYICQLCGKLQGDRVHDVHHVDYQKTNCNPENLITLCISCHAKTTHDQERWKEYFFNWGQRKPEDIIP